jgi:hypothetical protein
VPPKTHTVEIDCREVWKHLSSYMEGDLTLEMRRQLEHHLRGCRRCTAIYDGTKNAVRLLGDKRAIDLPRGFSERLHDRLILQSS